MPITVADAVSLPELQRGDPEILSDRRFDEEIRWVHIGDVPDLTGLLQGGELVLTTGAALANWPQRYLEGLAESGAVGVVVELGTMLPRLPPAVARIARAQDLALVVLHRTVRFVEVTEAVHRRIVAEQYDAVEFDRRAHETFTDLSMKRASVAAIVDAASRMLDEPVVLEDLAHRVLAVAASGQSDTASVLTDWERRSRRVAGATGVAERWLSTTVGPSGESWGRLIIPRTPSSAGRARTVLERAAVALALHRMIERDRTGLQQRAQSGLLDDVLEGRITAERDISARAHALGLRHAEAYVPLAIRIGSTRPDTDPIDAQRRHSADLEAIAHGVHAAGHSALFTSRSNGDIGAIAAVSATTPTTGDPLLGVAESIRAAAHRIDDAADCVVAAGTPRGHVADAILGLDDAAHVAEVATAMSGPRRSLYRAADVRLRGLIAVLKDDPRVQAFAETELRPVLAGTPDSLDLLREYLRVQGNKAALAQRLHISRPALYKRLRALEATLGADLGDGESMLSLHVAVLIHDVRSGHSYRTYER
ncbi:PucR family transcriptional regulator [Gordonia sp. NPDC003429]